MKRLKLDRALFLSAFCVIAFALSSCEKEQNKVESPTMEMEMETEVLVPAILTDSVHASEADSIQYDSVKSEQVPPIRR